MVGNGGVVCCQKFGKCFLVDVGIGGMDCASSCFDYKDRFMDK
jgi:hypothetical protein